MGNIFCLSVKENTVFELNQPVTCFVSTRSNDAIVYYDSITEAYDFASIVLDKYIGDKEGEIKPVLSFNQLCNILQKDRNDYITVDNNSIGSVSIYLGHFIHDDLLIYNPKIYREKDLIKHYQRVGKIESYFR
jgi:hypothetical protein